MINRKLFQHHPSSIKANPKEFPQEALNSLFGLFSLEESHHLLWKTTKLSQCSDAVQMEGEERLEMFNFCEALHDLLDAAYLFRKKAQGDQTNPSIPNHSD